MSPAHRRRPDPPPAHSHERTHTGTAFGLAEPRARGEDLDETAVMEIALAMREKLAWGKKARPTAPASGSASSSIPSRAPEERR